jgi:predicted secreted protein
LKGENGKMKRKAEKTWIMMALLLVSVSSMVKTSNSETRESAHALNSYSTSSAVTEWSERYGGLYDDAAYSLVNTNDGYVLAGSTSSSGAGSYDFWLVKTDSNGNKAWDRPYGGVGDDEAYSVIQTSDGGYVLAGFTNSSGNGGYDFWLVKTDSNGTELWNETYGGPSNDEAYSIVQAGDGGYVLAGYTRSFGNGGSDFWLVKTDASGNQQWDKTYGEERSDDKAYCVVQANGQGYALVGYTYSPSMSNDAWLVKTAAVYYKLNITITAGGTTDPTNGTYTYANWTDVPVTAHPNPGYLFDHGSLTAIALEHLTQPTC